MQNGKRRFSVPTFGRHNHLFPILRFEAPRIRPLLDTIFKESGTEPEPLFQVEFSAFSEQSTRILSEGFAKGNIEQSKAIANH